MIFCALYKHIGEYIQKCPQHGYAVDTENAIITNHSGDSMSRFEYWLHPVPLS